MSVTKVKMCYCSIGAGGKPCKDRDYCDKHGDHKFYEREAWIAGFKEAASNTNYRVCDARTMCDKHMKA